MKLIDMTCPHCGAHLHVDDGLSRVKCEYCDSVLLIDGGMRRGGADDGNWLDREQQRRWEEQRKAAPTPPAEPQKKRHTWLWVLGWIFMFPIPLTVLIVRSKKLSPLVKGLLIALVWLFFIGVAVSDEDDAETAEQAADAPAASDTQAAALTPTAAQDVLTVNGVSYTIL